MGRIAQSVQRLATGWTVRGSNSGGDEIFRTCPDLPWGPPSLLYNGYRVFVGGKVWLGRAADHPPPSGVEVKEQVEMYQVDASSSEAVDGIVSIKNYYAKQWDNIKIR